MAESRVGFTLGATDGSAVLDTYDYALDLRIGADSVLDVALLDSFDFTLTLGQPATVRLRLRMEGALFDPLFSFGTGDTFEIALDDNYTKRLFYGVITDIKIVVRDGPNTLVPFCDITAVDYSWKVGLSTLVWGWWRTKGINTIVRDVVEGLTDYTVGYLPGALGTLDSYEARGLTVQAVLDELATAANAYWVVDAYQVVHMFQTPDHLTAGTLAITNTSANVQRLEIDVDFSEYTSQAFVLGKATTLRAAVTPSSLSLPILSWEPFDYTSGTVVVGGLDVVTYTGGTTVPGSETLVFSGGSRVTRDWPEGTSVAPLASSGSATAARLVVADSVNAYAAATIATNLVTRYNGNITGIRGATVDGLHTGATTVMPGSTVSVNTTAPLLWSGSYRVQSVTFVPRRVDGVVRFERQFVAGPIWRYWDIFKQIMGI